MPKWIELVFAVRITTEDSYFVICGDSDLLTERETSGQRLELDLESYGLSVLRSAVPTVAKLLCH